MRFALLGASLLIACNPDSSTDTGKDTATDTDTGGDTDTAVSDDFCGVQEIFDNNCVVCHSASNPQGDLDLATDPYTALVNQSSPTYTGETRVVPGDSAGSLLYLKMTALQGANGDPMPTTGILDPSLTEVVRDWIDRGASSECGTIDTDTAPQPYHPEGWDAASEHGLGAKLRTDDCQSCHGEDLDGGSAGVTCDDCHDAGWRTDCTFCHGGTDNTTGAPPEDIDDSTTGLSFNAHTSHVLSDLHPDYDCVQCHTEPTDVLSDGHLFNADATPAIAEVTFSAGLSDVGAYGGSGTCSNLYCHGDGDNRNGSATDGDSFACDDCHGGMSGDGGSLGGEHAEHLHEGVSCEECHALTVSAATTISGPDKHVDGTVDISMPSGVTWTGSTCTGTCHDENHNNKSW